MMHWVQHTQQPFVSTIWLISKYEEWSLIGLPLSYSFQISWSNVALVPVMLFPCCQVPTREQPLSDKA